MKRLNLHYKANKEQPPKSRCKCGHTGDGYASEHAGAIGHGFCLEPKCKCQKFTWSHFLADEVGPEAA